MAGLLDLLRGIPMQPQTGQEQPAMEALARPPLPETQVIAAPNERADAIRSAFEAMRNGQGGPVPSMSAVTSNPVLLAADDRISQLAQLKDTLASMNPQSRAPEPVMPSDAARRGAYGGPAANADRFTRMAILNEQERNRVPTTAGKDATINLDTLPDQLKQVYAQRAANDSKRDAMVLGSGLSPVARTEADKAAKRAEYESAGLAVPAVYAGIASPEKVRADKLRRTQEESYRQGNYSLQEQARGLSQKLGINPMIATAIVADRMQRGPAADQSGEPRTPDSWEPRLRGGDQLSSMLGPFLQSAAYGPQGAAIIERQRVDNQGQVDAANAARGGMPAEQAAGLAAGRALIESGDPNAIQQGIQMVRQYLGGQAPGTNQPMPAPGMTPQQQHAAENGYPSQENDMIIEGAFNETDKGSGLGDWFGWGREGVGRARERAMQYLAGRGIQPDKAARLVDDWYRRKYEGSTLGNMPRPDQWNGNSGQALPALPEPMRRY